MINQYRTAKQTRAIIIADLCNQIDLQKQHIQQRTPKGLITGLVNSHKTVCPWITRDAINYELRRRKKNGIFYLLPSESPITTGVTGITPNDEDIQAQTTIQRAKGGRPDGTTDEKARHDLLAKTEAKNEITATFDNEKRMAGKKRLPCGRLLDIISDAKKRHGLPEDCVINESSIRSRLNR